MDSAEYFKRAEKSNRRFRRAVILLLVVMIAVLAAAGIVSTKASQDNHRENVNSLNIVTQNEVKLNQNLTGSLHCVLLLANSPTQFTNANINQCFNIPQNIVSQPNR